MTWIDSLFLFRYVLACMILMVFLFISFSYYLVLILLFISFSTHYFSLGICGFGVYKLQVLGSCYTWMFHTI